MPGGAAVEDRSLLEGDERTMAYRSRERVERVLSHQEADRVPFDTVGFPVEHARRWCDELGMSDD